MSDELPVGTKIKFTREITQPACGDHPTLLYAYEGDAGTIEGHNDDPLCHTYRVKTDNHPGEFWVYPNEIAEVT